MGKGLSRSLNACLGNQGGIIMTQQTKRNKEVLANAMTQVMTHIWDNEDDFSDAQFELLVSKVQELKSMLCENPIHEDKKDYVVVDSNENSEQTTGITSAEKLQELLNIITNEECIPGHLTPGLENYAKGKNKSGCIGAIVDESLWDGSLIGKVSKEQLIKGIVAIRNDFPEIFVPFNEELPIKDDSSSWTIGYFNTQRNLLRTNFALERLCHLVLVYEKLFCETAEEDNTAPFVAGSDNDKSNSDSQIRKTMKKKLLIVVGSVVVLILAILGILLLKMGNKTTVQSGTEHNTPSGSVSNNVSETKVDKGPSQSTSKQMPVGNKQKKEPSKNANVAGMPVGDKQKTKKPEVKTKPATMPVGDKTALPSKLVTETK